MYTYCVQCGLRVRSPSKDTSVDDYSWARMRVSTGSAPSCRYNGGMANKPAKRTSVKLPRYYRGIDIPMGIIRRYARQIAERFQPEKIILFGSHAYGTPHEDSDVDLLVEFVQPVGLFHFFRVPRRLEAIRGRTVDLVMKDAIKRQLRTRIMAEAVSAT